MKIRRPQYIPGDYLVVCDRCGFTIRSSEAKKTWDGLLVCADDYEARHPQDFVRGKEDKQSVPEPRPRPADVFLLTACTLSGKSSYAGYAVPGCAVAGLAPIID